MMILIDADGCPVVEETIDLAEAYGISVIIYCDYAHAGHRYESYAQAPHVSLQLCDQGKDSVDYQILHEVQSGDIVITQDYGLAQLLLTRNALPISQNGLRYTNDNIQRLLQQRDVYAHLRKKGNKTPNPKKRTEKATRDFCESLEALIEEVCS